MSIPQFILLIITALSGGAALLVIIIIMASRSEAIPIAKLLLVFSFNNIKIKGGNIMLELKSTQKVTGTLQPVDAKGNAAQVETGSVTVTSSDEEVVKVVLNPENELEFEVIATGKAGVAQVNFSADADLGDGVVVLLGFTAVEVQAGQAVGFSAVFGTPQEQESAAGETE